MEPDLIYHTDISLATQLVAFLKKATGYEMIREYQPTTQGTPSAPVLTYFKVSDKRIGMPWRDDVWNATTSIMTHYEVQRYETTFQIGALSTKDSSDAVNTAAIAMAGEEAIEYFKPYFIGVLQTTGAEVRNPYFVNDKDQFQASPSFDVTVVYNRARIITTPVITSVEYNVGRV